MNNEQQAYVDSKETIEVVSGAAAEGAENGAIAIRPRFRRGFVTPEGRSFDFTSGRLESRGKVEFTYGTASARIKLSAGAGLWPAFWALGAGRWPDTGEMDNRPTRAMVERYGRWAYDTPKFLILNLALGGQYPQAVNHVTSPYPGMPQATVDLVKADGVRMLIDWVRVTGR